jgi:hypothetical protein
MQDQALRFVAAGLFWMLKSTSTGHAMPHFVACAKNKDRGFPLVPADNIVSLVVAYFLRGGSIQTRGPTQ